MLESYEYAQSLTHDLDAHQALDLPVSVLYSYSASKKDKSRWQETATDARRISNYKV